MLNLPSTATNLVLQHLTNIKLRLEEEGVQNHLVVWNALAVEGSSLSNRLDLKDISFVEIWLGLNERSNILLDRVSVHGCPERHVVVAWYQDEVGDDGSAERDAAGGDGNRHVSLISVSVSSLWGLVRMNVLRFRV